MNFRIREKMRNLIAVVLTVFAFFTPVCAQDYDMLTRKAQLLEDGKWRNYWKNIRKDVAKGKIKLDDGVTADMLEQTYKKRILALGMYAIEISGHARSKSDKIGRLMALYNALMNYAAQACNQFTPRIMDGGIIAPEESEKTEAAMEFFCGAYQKEIESRIKDIFDFSYYMTRSSDNEKKEIMLVILFDERKAVEKRLEAFDKAINMTDFDADKIEKM